MRFVTCFDCQNRDRCKRLGCRLFNQKAHEKEEKFINRLIDDSANEIDEIFKRKATHDKAWHEDRRGRNE